MWPLFFDTKFYFETSQLIGGKINIWCVNEKGFTFQIVAEHIFHHYTSSDWKLPIVLSNTYKRVITRSWKSWMWKHILKYYYFANKMRIIILPRCIDQFFITGVSRLTCISCVYIVVNGINVSQKSTLSAKYSLRS